MFAWLLIGRRSFVFLAFACCLAYCLTYCLAGAGPLAAQEEDDDDLQPGLLAHYAASGKEAVRVDRVLAFDWGAQPPDRRLSPGPFRVAWRGYLMSQAVGNYRISAYLQGKVRLELAGKVVLEGEQQQPGWLQSDLLPLQFDWHALKIEYSSSSISGNRTAARIALFWSGPQFQREPIPWRNLHHDTETHDTETSPDGNVEQGGFEQGALLARALRCEACHRAETGQHFQAPLAGPALDRLRGNLSPGWVIDRLSNQDRASEHATRRMPHFELSLSDASAIAAYLFSAGKQPTPQKQKLNGKLKEGQRLFLSLGCLACHQQGELGNSGLFGGGDLTRVAEKHPPGFFQRWLQDPAKINRDHRMPIFEMNSQERTNLAAYLRSLGVTSKNRAPKKGAPRRKIEISDDASVRRRGAVLAAENRCGACHQLPEPVNTPSLKPLASLTAAHWEKSCLTAGGRRPHYRLAPQEQRALRTYFASLAGAATEADLSLMSRGRLLLAERNCLACHRRNADQGIAPSLLKLGVAHPELAAQIPALTPPALNSIGDKLKNEAFEAILQRKGPARRPWLAVRMPRFNLSDQERSVLTKFFVAADRIPEYAAEEKEAAEEFDVLELNAAGKRLVTTSGFGCTSCHQVGEIIPPQAPLAAKGPNLSEMQHRIRRPWFERWVRNPARITPKMEMPAVQVAVRGLLDDHLDAQIASVWRVLNQPGFQPPLPDPVRVLRRTGVRKDNQRAVIGTDVILHAGATIVQPFLAGLANRHSLLFDLATHRTAGWWIGDAANQQTKGKSWFWEAAGVSLFSNKTNLSDLALTIADKTIEPALQGQFITELDSWRHVEGGVAFSYRLRYLLDAKNATQLDITQRWTSIGFPGEKQATGLRRKITISGAPAGAEIVWRVAPKPSGGAKLQLANGKRRVLLADGGQIQIVAPAEATLDADGALRFSVGDNISHKAAQPVVIELAYLTDLPVDQYLLVAPKPPAPQAVVLDVAPGFISTQLPLTDVVMPTKLTWRPDGTLVVCSLKGRVFLARDTNHDGLEDELQVFSDDLAAPFGVQAAGKYIDVANKFALLRLFDDNADGRADRTQVLASGWGHTTDYHDWAIGLPCDGRGGYYMAFPCQQDDRSPAAARYRGQVVHLTPRTPTPENPQRFTIAPLTSGHRFPIGIARNKAGDLFVTDNQGNYNPFNELNHIVPGKSYGFINKIDRKPGFQPPLTPPAIDIPHPWTRSVNGICFLETPPALRQKIKRDIFGPFEGHLIGCEINNRKLIRMSFQQVGDTIQGAAYPFSYETPPGPTFLGPLSCAVSPAGDLYVGSLLDSGWGGGSNIGGIVRMRPQFENLPTGIAEVRAYADNTGGGFAIKLTGAVSAEKAENAANYSVSSYTRTSTPAYGGEDQNRRIEKIEQASLSPDGTTIRLQLKSLRAGYVYEIRVRNLLGKKQLFFPAEAYYTMRVLPQ